MPTDAIRMLMRTLKCVDVELCCSDGRDDQRNCALVDGADESTQLVNDVKIHGLKGTRCGELRVGFSDAVRHMCRAESVKASDLALVEGVFWELLR